MSFSVDPESYLPKEYITLKNSGSKWINHTVWGEAITYWFVRITEHRAIVPDACCGEARGVAALKRHGYRGIRIAICKLKIGKWLENGFDLRYDDFHCLKSLTDKYVEYTLAWHCVEHPFIREPCFRAILRVVCRQFAFALGHNPEHASSINDRLDFIRIVESLEVKHRYFERARA